MMVYFPIMIVALLMAVFGQSQMMTGGYNSVDVKSADVKNAAAYAIGLQYPNQNPLPRYTVKSAQVQMVAGKKYKLSIQLRVRTAPKSCSVTEYIVYEKFQPTNKYSLEKKTVTATKC